jgi:hypothetical protein
MNMAPKTQKDAPRVESNAVRVYALDKPSLRATWQQDATANAWHSEDASFALWLNSLCDGALPVDIYSWCDVYGLAIGEPPVVTTPADALAADTTAPDTTTADTTAPAE